MVSFGEFIINLFEKLGLYYVFSVIFVFIIVYVLFTIFLKQFFKDVFSDKQINVISIIFGFVVAMLSITVYGVVKLISYFLSFVVIMLLAILFILISLTFVLSKKPTLEGTNLRNVFLIVTVLIVIFIFVSFYFVYEQSISSVVYEAVPSFFVQEYRPEILIASFILIILGIFIMVISVETRETKK